MIKRSKYLSLFALFSHFLRLFFDKVDLSGDGTLLFECSVAQIRGVGVDTPLGPP